MLKDILLLEPNYKAKYPPLGLMKLSYFHKKKKKDYVIFAKGKLPDNLKDKKFDRVYVSTLFTYEWEKSIKTIKYAKTLLKNKKEFKNKIFIGGILATLMSSDIEKETGIKPIRGRLNKKGKLGYEDDDIVDNITPDYSILDEIDYEYATDNAYFAFMTRGCKMGCEFCAVSTLEPEYENYISIKNQIENINKEYGEKRNLLLMDNNVLLSSCFEKIIEEIKEIGFYKGATYINPKTGSKVKRYVDFNQGLDANLLTEKKVSKLSEIAIRPSRIAFDHIEDKDTYIQAIKRCANYGIANISNYVLYNGENFTAKGQEYKADKPEDLYKRLRITVDLMREYNNSNESKISIYSFPMKYVPLKNKNRIENKYVGPNWNKKFLRAVQAILIPTMGKGVSGSDDFFEAAFGKDKNEFKKVLMMPESIIVRRGHFTKKSHETNEQREKRFQKWTNNKSIRKKWEELYKKVNKEELLKIISDNTFGIKKYFKIKDNHLKKIYLFYLSNYKKLSLFNEISKRKANEIKIIYDYFVNEFPLMLINMSKYIYEKQISYKLLKGYLDLFGRKGTQLLFEQWVNNGFMDNSNFLDRMGKGMSISKEEYFDINKIICIDQYMRIGCMNNDDVKKFKSYLLDLNESGVLNIIRDRFSTFKNTLDEIAISSEEEVLINKIKNTIKEQLSLFD